MDMWLVLATKEQNAWYSTEPVDSCLMTLMKRNKISDTDKVSTETSHSVPIASGSLETAAWAPHGYLALTAWHSMPQEQECEPFQSDCASFLPSVRFLFSPLVLAPGSGRYVS